MILDLCTQCSWFGNRKLMLKRALRLLPLPIRNKKLREIFTFFKEKFKGRTLVKSGHCRLSLVAYFIQVIIKLNSLGIEYRSKQDCAVFI